MIKIVFIGPPGSGKGTHARMLSLDMGIPLVSLGDIIRDEVERKTKLGKKAEGYIKRGELVPDTTVAKIFLSHLPDSFILDGFPRNVYQAETLDKFGVNIVVHLSIEPESLIQRIANRRICPKCKRVYNLVCNPPGEDEICDVCKVKLITREDDEEEVVRKRMEVYKKETETLVNYYRKKDILIELDTGDSIEKVHKRILDAVRSRTE